MADTKIRTVRVPDWLWRRALAKAKRQDTDVSTLVRAWLREYVREN
jgi:predicted HicB family RNase H-like nuclease